MQGVLDNTARGKKLQHNMVTQFEVGTHCFHDMTLLVHQHNEVV